MIAKGEPPNFLFPFGAVEYGAKRLSADEMRAAIFNMIGCSNFIVGFYLGWTLSALNLALPGHCVVILDTELAFQYWCRSLTERRSGLRDAFI